MGWFCGDNTTTQSTQPGALTKEAGGLALTRAKGINSASAPSYSGQRVADFTPNQTQAFNLVNQFATQPSPLNERVVDQGGRLGAISDYVDPYIAAVLGPQIREIQRAGAQQRIGIGDAAQGAHAYGDARHGVVESEQMRNEMQNIGDVTGQAYSNAWNNAMGLRGADRTSFGQGDQDVISRYLAMLGIGDRQQQQQQQQLDTSFQDWQTKNEWQFRQLDALLSFLTGNPTAQTVTTKQPSSGVGGLVGAALGALL